MLKEQINQLIKEAMLQGDKVRLETLRSVKTAFLNFETAKNAKPLDDVAEINILKKLASSREESIEQFKTAGRIDLVEKETQELEILKSFLPEPIKEEEIEEVVKNLIQPGDGMKDMGRLVKEVKTKLPTADGAIIAKVVKNQLGNVR